MVTAYGLFFELEDTLEATEVRKPSCDAVVPLMSLANFRYIISLTVSVLKLTRIDCETTCL